MKTINGVLLAAAMFCSGIASAQTVYKCEENGKAAYKDQQCAGGKDGKTIKINTPPAEADAASAKQRAASEKAQEQKLTKQRLKREAAEERERQKAAQKAAAKQKKCDQLRLQMKWADEDARRATGKHHDKAQTKSRRTTEKYVLTCQD